MNTWLIIGWLFTCSWLPDQSFVMYNKADLSKSLGESHKNANKIELSIDACLWNRWDIYGGMASYQVFNGFCDSGVSFCPYSIDYKIGTEVYLLPKDNKKFNVSVFAEHECQHPVEVINVVNHTEISSFTRSYTEVGVKVKGSISF